MLLKRIISFLLSGLCVFTLVSCNQSPDTSNPEASSTNTSSATSQTGVSTNEQGVTITQTNGQTNITTGSGDVSNTNTPSNSKTSATTKRTIKTETPVESKDVITDYKTNGYSSNMVVGVDQFGRSFNASSSYRSNKQVGMFYWLWIGQPFANGIYDATKIASMPNGNKLLYDPKSLNNSISPDGQAHFWGEPLWGYYNSMDEWVIRKQMKMLTMAEIDFIVFDTTNAITYRDVYLRVLKVIDELQKEGWNPPKVAFYTHSRSMKTTTQIYNELYKRNLYPNTWYRVNGKPMIISYTSVELDKKEALSRGDTSYEPVMLSDEILNFFYIKKPQWPFDPVYQDGFPWVEWTYPQPLHTDMMSVTVASHPSCPFSFTITRNLENWGRGWNPATKKNVSADVDKGTFFQKQWDHALNVDPEMIFVGGWNEWIAYKQIYDGEYVLVDACSKEFSRDIEPMKGGYEDAFYLQLIRNVRKYKGSSKKMTAESNKTINISGDVSQWSNVKTVYRDIGAANKPRNEYSVTSKVRYTQAAARNNLQTVKVAQDANNLYFMVECASNITAYKGEENWMNIFLSAGNPKSQGWEGYNYVINRKPSGGKTTIHKLSADFKGTEVGEAEYKVSGKTLQIKVPKSAVGITGSTNSFYFKVTDGIQNASDIMDSYVTGESMPMGRLSYSYTLKNY